MEKETIKQFKATTNEAILKDSKDKKSDSSSQLSVTASDEKIAKLTQLLKENAELEKANITPQIKESRDNVIKCLKDNQGKSLNCWDQVEAFNKLVRDL